MQRRKLIFLGLGSIALTASGGYATNLSKPTETLSNEEPSLASVTTDRLFQFVAAGDVGTGDREQYDVARAMYHHWEISPFSLALLAGDNIYENGEIEKIAQVFERPYAQLLVNGVKFYAALGNHDVRTNQGEDQIAYSGYNMTSRYYSFTEQSVQFFALDTNQAYSGRQEQHLWDEQLAWLESELEQSTALWKVVFGHHPVYSSGQHGSQPKLIEDLSPIFEQQGVQLYINGHDHNYERTRPIDGTTYITTGNGAKRRQISKSDWTALISDQFGFTTFDVHPDRIIVKAISTRNTVYDEGHIPLND